MAGAKPAGTEIVPIKSVSRGAFYTVSFFGLQGKYYSIPSFFFSEC